MIASGIDIVTVADDLGHSNPGTTAKYYAHIIDEVKKKSAQARASVFKKAHN